MSGKGRPQSVINSYAHKHYALWTTGTAATEYPIQDEVSLVSKTVARVDDVLVFVAGTLFRPADQVNVNDYRVRGLQENTPASEPAYPGDSNTILFTVAPNGLPVCFLVAGG